MQLRSVRSWVSVDNDDAPSCCTVAEWLDEFKELERTFEDSPRTGRPPTIITDENVEAVEQIGKSLSVSLLTNRLFQQQQFMRSSVII